MPAWDALNVTGSEEQKNLASDSQVQGAPLPEAAQSHFIEEVQSRGISTELGELAGNR